MNYELKLFEFFNSIITEDHNRTEIEDEYGNKIITFLIIDDCAISFFFNNSGDLIACNTVI
jgi:hypothetical protein